MLSNVPPAVKFRLQHSRSEAPPETLFTAKVAGDNLDATAESITEKAMETSAQHTSSFGGMPQRYTLSAITKDKQRIAAHSWMDKSSRSMPIVAPGYGESTEAPTSTGLLQSMMRHVEIANRTLVEAIAGIAEHQTKVIEEQREQLEAHGKDRMRLVSLLEDLRSQRQAREIEREEYERNAARKEALAKKVIDEVIPEVAPFVKAFVGKKLGISLLGSGEGEAPSATSSGKTRSRERIALDRLGRSLTPEQQVKLLELFTPEQATYLTEALGDADDSAPEAPSPSTGAE